jgi:hypothetical protein
MLPMAVWLENSSGPRGPPPPPLSSARASCSTDIASMGAGAPSSPLPPCCRWHRKPQRRATDQHMCARQAAAHREPFRAMTQADHSY